MTYQTFETIAHATRLYQAGMEEELKQFILSLNASKHADVMQALPWLHQLSLAASTITDTNLPATVYARSEGWRHYFKGDYIEAHECFKQSVAGKADNDWRQLAYDAALGMAKVYTRSGHWQSAKEWVLEYLIHARQKRDDYGLVKGYGALAEIFLRANSPKQALACFQISNQMMPSGQGQLDKQYNYIASALIRNGEYLRAETLLRNSMKLSKDKMNRDAKNCEAQIGYLHSYARLSYLNLAQNKPIRLSSAAKSLIRESLQDSAITAIKIPAGFINVALMIEAFKNDELPQQQSCLKNSYLDRAEQLFTNVPMERQWVLNMRSKLDLARQDKPAHSYKDKIAEQLINLTPMPAPQSQIILDATWQQEQLTNSGYQPLLKNDVGLEELTQLWRLFFI